MLLMGLNDRKRMDGISELSANSADIIDILNAMGKYVVLITPNPSAASNEYLPNRIYHTDEVVRVLKCTAKEKDVVLVDNYEFINSYLTANGQIIDDIIYEANCKNDGLHPSDTVQKLMFDCLISTLEI